MLKMYNNKNIYAYTNSTTTTTTKKGKKKKKRKEEKKAEKVSKPPLAIVSKHGV